MKYLYYIILTIFMLVRKIIAIPYFWFVIPFRGYARSVVYSYVLRNNVYLKRLLERDPKWDYKKEGWVLRSPWHKNAADGFVKFRKVSKLKYYLVYFFIWGWLDDDANNDLYDAGHSQRVGNLKYVKKIPILSRGLLEEAHIGKLEDTYWGFGNTFDLGDLKYKNKFQLFSTIVWNFRNGAYNFNYMDGQTIDKNIVFQWTPLKSRPEATFGWIPEELVKVNDRMVRAYSHRFPIRIKYWRKPKN